jgi:predicted RNase H-like HicB family nuclease
MSRYVVVIEETDQGYSAYVPDLPGCVAAANTRRDTTRLIREALQLHIESLRDDQEEVPVPTTSTVTVEV